MTYWTLGIALALTAFLAVNVLVSAGVALLASLADSRASAGVLLGLRALPSAASAALTLGVFAPSYLLFEPWEGAEPASAPLVILAAAGLVLFVTGVVRAAGAWRMTAILVRRWERFAESFPLSGEPAPTLRVRDAFPVVAVVGSVRPRLYVASQVLEALEPPELAAVLAHEAAHLAARDNLKRLVFRAAPDLLSLLPASRALERRWACASEAEADTRAACGDRSIGLDLASALLKVARLVPEGAPRFCAASPLHDGEEVRLRVERLAAGPLAPREAGRFGLLVLGGLTLLAGLCLPGAWALAHTLTEAAVLLAR